MSNTIFTAPQAVARSKSFTRYQVGMCQNFVWRCLDYDRRAGINNANEGWYRTTMKRYTSNPPAGAPVFWSGGTYGHVALSLGNGYVRSTDWPSKGYVGNVLITRLSSAWGKRYRGWGADYAGHPIAGLGVYPAAMSVDKTTVIYASRLRPGARNADVARFEKALWNYLGGAYRASILANKAAVGDGYYGDLTKAMCSDAYARAGMPRATYPGGTALLRALGFTNART